MVRRRAAYVIDETASWLARRLHRRSPPHPNTRRELALYLGKSIPELFPAPPGYPNVTIRRRWKIGRFKCDDLTFESFHEPICPKFRIRHEIDYEANHTVHVRWFRHRSRARRPTLIYLHSWMYPETLLDELTLVPRLAKTLGVDIARMQLPYHGKRKPAHSIFHGEMFWSADLVRSVEAVRQSVMDARTLLGWLRERRGLEAGVAGVSLGGIVTLALACVEPRLAFAIPMGAHTDIAAVIEEASLLTVLRMELAQHGWTPADLADYVRQLGLMDLRPCIPRDRILLVGGLYDRFLTAQRIQDLWKRWGEPPIHWFPGGHLHLVANLRGIVGAARDFLDGIDLESGRRTSRA